MNKEQAVHRWVLSRETHSSRTGVAVTLASVVIVLLVAGIALGVWWLVDRAFRDVMAGQVAAVSSIAGDGGALMAAGSISVVLAVFLIAVALLPGRLARRARSTDRLALLVDDGVLADAVADAVAARCGIDPRQVSATINRRRATVRVTPTSGVDVDRAAATDSAVATLAAVGFSVAPKLLVAPRGVVA